MRNTILSLLIVVVGVIGFSSCDKGPDYPTVPQIEFRDIGLIPNPSKGIDTLFIDIGFEDKEGDLGLDESDVGKDPFVDEFSTNFRASLFRKENGEFVEIDDLGVSLGGRFSPLVPKDKLGPIDGVITHLVVIPRSNNPVLSQGDTLRLEVSILDRALNVSNTVTTGEVVYIWD